MESSLCTTTYYTSPYPPILVLPSNVHKSYLLCTTMSLIVIYIQKIIFISIQVLVGFPEFYN